MEPSPGSNGPGRRLGLFALGALISGIGLIAAAVIISALGATAVSASSSCDPTSSPVSVHYQTAVATSGSDSRVAVSGVVLSGFPTACDGSTVTLELLGNKAGDPTVAPSADTLLSTADSTLDPCSQKTLATPLVVAGGSITLSLCASGGPAGYASVHDLTALALFLPAGSGGVLGASTSTGSVVPTPVTGSAFSVPYALFALGLALLVAGTITLARTSRQEPGPN